MKAAHDKATTASNESKSPSAVSPEQRTTHPDLVVGVGILAITLVFAVTFGRIAVALLALEAKDAGGIVQMQLGAGDGALDSHELALAALGAIFVSIVVWVAVRRTYRGDWDRRS